MTTECVTQIMLSLHEYTLLMEDRGWYFPRNNADPSISIISIEHASGVSYHYLHGIRDVNEQP